VSGEKGRHVSTSPGLHVNFEVQITYLYTHTRLIDEVIDS